MYCLWYRSSTCKEGKTPGVLGKEWRASVIALRTSRGRGTAGGRRDHDQGGPRGTLLGLLDDKISCVSLGQRTVRRYAGSTEKGPLEIGVPSLRGKGS